MIMPASTSRYPWLGSVFPGVNRGQIILTILYSLGIIGVLKVIYMLYIACHLHKVCLYDPCYDMTGSSSFPPVPNCT